MEVVLQPGKYVVAVSGGVDSVVLLDMLAKQVKSSSNNSLVVAHFDHGIRLDSAADAAFVQKLAAAYDLPFYSERTELGNRASENAARKARYAFLRKVKEQVGAGAIITAHHQDDVLETALINLLRGTKSRGLFALRSREDVLRPLLQVSKKQILAYAREHRLDWREDSTNQDETYVRNYVRRKIVANMTAVERARLLKYIEKAAVSQQIIDDLVAQFLSNESETELGRKRFVALPSEVAKEVLATWLKRSVEGVEVTSKMLARLDEGVRGGQTGKRYDVANGYQLLLTKTAVQLTKKQIQGEAE